RKYVVTKVKHASLAWTSGVLMGDTIHSINGTTVNKNTELKEVYKMMKTQTLRMVVSSVSEPKVETTEVGSPSRKKSSFSLGQFTRLNLRRSKSELNIPASPDAGDSVQSQQSPDASPAMKRSDSNGMLAGLLSPLRAHRQRSATVVSPSSGTKSGLNPDSAKDQTQSRRRNRAGTITPVVAPELTQPLAVPKGRRIRSASVGAQAPAPAIEKNGSPLHQVINLGVKNADKSPLTNGVACSQRRSEAMPDEPPPVYTLHTSPADNSGAGAASSGQKSENQSSTQKDKPSHPVFY
ncbi:hypothetical protein SARC_11269, partial [Sphaeroforma arctica JP610]